MTKKAELRLVLIEVPNGYKIELYGARLREPRIFTCWDADELMRAIVDYGVDPDISQWKGNVTVCSPAKYRGAKKPNVTLEDIGL